MGTNFGYGRLPPLHESQDIAETTWTTYTHDQSIDLQPLIRSPHSNSSLPGYTAAAPQRDVLERYSIDSLETRNSTSTGRLKSSWVKGFDRLRRKSRASFSKDAINQHPAAEIEATRIGRGVWSDQLLVDRSLRFMALLTSVFAFTLVIVICVNAKDYFKKKNRSSSSVGGKPGDCGNITRANTAILLLINAGATMLLGMSNTYQQLVTSLRVDDILPMLQKFGDSRVGTNSPFNINHKNQGKKKSWAAWTLLVATSIPIHFLANSVVGPSYVIVPPRNVEYNATSYKDMWYPSYSSRSYVSYDFDSSGSFVCWSAFRTGKAHFAESTLVSERDRSSFGDSTNLMATQTFAQIMVHYDAANCSSLRNSTKGLKDLENSYIPSSYSYVSYSDSNCTMGENVACTLSGPESVKCRLNVRMNAAFVLATALVIKAVYMVAVNLRARGRLKRHLLTFGDVIVASASHPELRVQGECMVNASESYRRKNTHTCHTHCKNPEISETGDEIGHCQKCKKYNSTDKLANKPQPTIATKIKRSFITNIGNTALTQILIMMFVSLALLGTSLALAVILGYGESEEKAQCDYIREQLSLGSKSYTYLPDGCKISSMERFNKMSGGWGGFNHSVPITNLPVDEISSEFAAFAISNGAQFIYSLLYVLMIYNLTLISQEYDWGRLEHKHKRLRCTMVKGENFEQDYLLQLPKKVLFPVMLHSVLTHWVLGEALQTQEAIWMDDTAAGRHIEHSMYIASFATYPIWVATVMSLTMTGICWWSFTYYREGFIPQMFGSIRVLCAATSQLDDFPLSGIQWGDLGSGPHFRHAGLAPEVEKIVPYEVYAGTGETGREIEDDSGSRSN